MKIIYSKGFEKSYEKLPEKLHLKIKQRIRLFNKNPFHPLLRNHSLKGIATDKRSISITGDIRIIFEEHDNYTLVLMLAVGTHNQVY